MEVETKRSGSPEREVTEKVMFEPAVSMLYVKNAYCRELAYPAVGTPFYKRIGEHEWRPEKNAWGMLDT